MLVRAILVSSAPVKRRKWQKLVATTATMMATQHTDFNPPPPPTKKYKKKIPSSVPNARYPKKDITLKMSIKVFKNSQPQWGSICLGIQQTFNLMSWSSNYFTLFISGFKLKCTCMMSCHHGITEFQSLIRAFFLLFFFFFIINITFCSFSTIV